MREHKKGDVIIFQYDKANLFVKRVIGLPGEEIIIRDNRVYINGKEYRERYLKEKMETSVEQIFKVPQGSYFVLEITAIIPLIQGTGMIRM